MALSVVVGEARGGRRKGDVGEPSDVRGVGHCAHLLRREGGRHGEHKVRGLRALLRGGVLLELAEEHGEAVGEREGRCLALLAVGHAYARAVAHAREEARDDVLGVARGLLRGCVAHAALLAAREGDGGGRAVVGEVVAHEDWLTREVGKDAANATVVADVDALHEHGGGGSCHRCEGLGNGGAAVFGGRCPREGWSGRKF
mmetsp:Transcript_41915/g.102788  ORF Transcript_41915/g.102788 Transcript_41915/m.102788 type:complete len:201 (+) Transcript_41915:486-1088(+)